MSLFFSSSIESASRKDSGCWRFASTPTRLNSDCPVAIEPTLNIKTINNKMLFCITVPIRKKSALIRGSLLLRNQSRGGACRTTTHTPKRSLHSVSNHAPNTTARQVVKERIEHRNSQQRQQQTERLSAAH